MSVAAGAVGEGGGVGGWVMDPNMVILTHLTRVVRDSTPSCCSDGCMIPDTDNKTHD